MLLANYHTHTARCRHAWGEDKEYVENAIISAFKVFPPVFCLSVFLLFLPFHRDPTDHLCHTVCRPGKQTVAFSKELQIQRRFLRKCNSL